MRALIITAALAVLFLPLSSCAKSGIDIETVRPPEQTATDFPLHPEHWAEPKIGLLRRQENLDAVVEGAEDEFDRFIRLQSWVRAQWPIGDPDPYPLCNGVDILAAIRSGRTGGFCGQYCYLLADALKSFGYFSVRYVELETPDGDSHFAVEAWSNQFDRWVLLDPTYNIHYRNREGLPLNALELHNALLGQTTTDVRAMEGTPPPRDGKRVGDLPQRGLDFFSRFAVSTRSDLAHLDLPLTIADREKTFIRWDDPRGSSFRNMKFVLATSRASDLYPPVGQVDASVVKIDGQLVRIELSTRGSLPYLLAYQVRMDGGPWRRSGPSIEWRVPDGEHLLEFAAVNVAGVAGPVFGLRARR